jgi:hypothetical protein
MWKSVIEHLNKEGCVGDALPIACHQHQDSVQYVSQPGELPLISPDGESFPRVHIINAQLLLILRWMLEAM